MRTIIKYFKKKVDKENLPGPSNKTEKWFVIEKIRAGYVLVQNESLTNTLEAAINYEVKEDCEVILKQRVGDHFSAEVADLRDIIRKPKIEYLPGPTKLDSKLGKAVRIIALSSDTDSNMLKQASS